MAVLRDQLAVRVARVPLILTILARVGVVSAQVLAKYRKHAILAALILSAVVTPDATLFHHALDGCPLNGVV